MTSSAARAAVRAAREQALRWLYCRRVNAESQQLPDLSDLPELGDGDGADAAYLGGAQNVDWLDDAEALWRAFSSAPSVDPMTWALLQLGTWELQNRPDIDAPETLNGIINLAHDYAPTDAYKYVNAVLQGVAQRLQRLPDGRV